MLLCKMKRGEKKNDINGPFFREDQESQCNKDSGTRWFNLSPSDFFSWRSRFAFERVTFSTLIDPGTYVFYRKTTIFCRFKGKTTWPCEKRESLDPDASVRWTLWKMRMDWHGRLGPQNGVSWSSRLSISGDQWKKPWLFRVYRGLYYPVI